MTKKNYIVLAVTLLAVVGFYLYLFKDSFHKAGIQISHTFRPNPRQPAGVAVEAANENLNFGLTGDYKLTSVKVVPDAEFATNKFVHPLWELVSDSNSVPTRVFSYGTRIKGMHPTVKGAQPGALEGNVPYRLLVQAGPIKGEHVFTIPETNPTP